VQLIVRVTVFVALPPLEFVARKVTLVVPLAVGVPVTCPVEAFKVKPAGRVLPLLMLYVRGKLFGSVAVTVKFAACPWVSV